MSVEEKHRGYVYDPALGDPGPGPGRAHIAPGTPFETLPDGWCCPDCRAPKSDFFPLSAGEVEP